MRDAFTNLITSDERQHNRILRLSFPHGDGPGVVLLANTLEAAEGLSRPFEYTLELLSDDASIERDDLHREVLRTQGRLTQRTGYNGLGRRNWQAAGVDPAALGPGTGQFWRSYRYNRLGELAEQHDSVRGRLTYHYDPAGHLLRQIRDAEPSEERFAWDAAVNLLEHGHGKSAGRVEGNRLMVWGDIRFDYDPWGMSATSARGLA